MKRKISIVLVLAVCLSLCFSSVTFADKTSDNGYAGTSPAYGTLSWNNNSASSYIGCGGASYVYTRVQFCYQFGSIYINRVADNSATGSYAIGATATAIYTPVTRVAARGEYIASNTGGTWHPKSPYNDYWATWIGDFPNNYILQ
ncbi:MAG TPA: hypothetical protein PK566_15595 [Pseudobacteroides sp.]|jgi:hypothetical protein|nr:hypothetical protein [Pseudobacteroides sp.]